VVTSPATSRIERASVENVTETLHSNNIALPHADRATPEPRRGHILLSAAPDPGRAI
jgi:hypothetical protein